MFDLQSFVCNRFDEEEVLVILKAIQVFSSHVRNSLILERNLSNPISWMNPTDGCPRRHIYYFQEIKTFRPTNLFLGMWIVKKWDMRHLE